MKPHIIVCLAWLCLPGWVVAEDKDAGESQFLSRVRQLTLEGRRSGEGYFSSNGNRIIFQSEREKGNPFYQIYTMSLETGDVARVSPGSGKTTCAFFHPNGERVLFASTHVDPKAVDKQKAELNEIVAEAINNAMDRRPFEEERRKALTSFAGKIQKL